MLDHSPKAIARARRLRQCATKSEIVFWERVRGGQIGGFRIRRQVPIAGLIVDFACVSKRAVIEIDGGVHRDPDVQARGIVRDKRLSELGYRVFRFGDRAVHFDLEAVVAALQQELLNRLRWNIGAVDMMKNSPRSAWGLAYTSSGWGKGCLYTCFCRSIVRLPHHPSPPAPLPVKNGERGEVRKPHPHTPCRPCSKAVGSP